MSECLESLGGLKECLGRDAAPVEADTADFGFLHNSYIESVLSGPYSGNISARARTYYYYVVLHIEIIIQVLFRGSS